MFNSNTVERTEAALGAKTHQLYRFLMELSSQVLSEPNGHKTQHVKLSV